MELTIRRIIFVTAALLLLVSMHPAISHGLTLDSARDCDDNAVIKCGAQNFTELQSGFNQTGTAQIYSKFGISQDDINNIQNTAVSGVVTDKNNVWIHKDSGQCPNINTGALSSQNQQAIQNNPNLCLVATDAMTAGRQSTAGSTPVTVDNMTFFERQPSDIFQSSSLTAFVVMSNNQFRFAILSSCGNPVMATPVPVMQTVRPTSSTTTTAPTAPTQTQTQSQTVTVNTPTATPAVQSAVTTKPATTTLPNTGAGNVLSIFSATTLFGTVGHWFYVRRRIV